MRRREIIIYIVVMLALICTSVYATVSGDISLSVDSQNKAILPGDEFEVTLSLDNLNAEEGLKAVEGYIDIDENVLENLTIDSIVTENGKVTINEDNVLNVTGAVNSDEPGIIFNTNPVSGNGDYKLVINFVKEVKTNLNLVTIKFKVKSDVNPGKYTGAISYKTFKIFSDDEKNAEEIKTKSITVEVSKPNNNDKPVNNEVTNKPNNNVKNNTVKNDTVKNNTTNPNRNTTNSSNGNKSKDPVKNTQTNPTKNTPSQGSGSTRNPNIDNTVAKTPIPKTGYRIVLIPDRKSVV